MKSYHFPQIDLMKGLAIAAVLIWHSVPVSIQNKFFFDLHVGQAIPIFLIILGFNSSNSLSRKNYSVTRKLLSLEYLTKQIRRIIVPLAITWIGAIVTGFALKSTLGIDILRLNRTLIAGRLPVAGPGNYFISLLLQFIVVFPVLYRLYLRFPQRVIVAAFIVEALYQLTTSYFIFPLLHYLALGYLSPVVLGIWLSTASKARLKMIRFLPFAIVSVGYIISVRYKLIYPATLFSSWPFQNLITVFYPLALVVLGLRYLPRQLLGLPQNLLALFGRASYHIFLIQIIYFAINPLGKLAILIGGFKYLLDTSICLAIGTGYYFLLKNQLKLNVQNHSA